MPHPGLWRSAAEPRHPGPRAGRRPGGLHLRRARGELRRRRESHAARAAHRVHGPAVRRARATTPWSRRASRPRWSGMGLLEAVPEEAILRHRQGAGEARHRRASRTTSGTYENEQTVLGRFGWKANQPSLRQQTAAAFLGDIGATTFLFPEENCPALQVACLDVPSASKCGGQGGCTGQSIGRRWCRAG